MKNAVESRSHAIIGLSFVPLTKGDAVRLSEPQGVLFLSEPPPKELSPSIEFLIMLQYLGQTSRTSE